MKKTEIGIKNGVVNVITIKHFLYHTKLFAPLINLFVPKYYAVKYKKDFIKVLENLTIEEIENGVVILLGRKLSLSPTDFNVPNINNLNVLNFNHSYWYDGADEHKNDFILNRKRFTLEDIED